MITAADRAKPSIQLSIAKARPLSQPHVSTFYLQMFNDWYQGQHHGSVTRSAWEITGVRY